ncbi:hypothetical protein [Pectinatus frisingensis]|uniref:hypothetical protein n=1 Tax=Pectinatus frisingensis TaxID=865 RepID=UPI0018C66E71|nr:hypothetical protein [Pectinatus frisingensis]
MALFKGFNQADLLERNPRFLCAVLAEQLTLTNKALEAVSEEVKQLKKAKEKCFYTHGPYSNPIGDARDCDTHNGQVNLTSPPLHLPEFK